MEKNTMYKSTKTSKWTTDLRDWKFDVAGGQGGN